MSAILPLLYLGIAIVFFASALKLNAKLITGIFVLIFGSLCVSELAWLGINFAWVWYPLCTIAVCLFTYEIVRNTALKQKDKSLLLLFIGFLVFANLSNGLHWSYRYEMSFALLIPICIMLYYIFHALRKRTFIPETKILILFGIGLIHRFISDIIELSNS